MIRINLLPRKKKKRKAAPIEGEQTIAAGMGIIMAVAAGLYFFVHLPQQEEIENQKKAVRKLTGDNKKISDKISDFKQRKIEFESAQKQAVAIEQLNNARSSPANFLFELATILKQGGEPTMTKEMVARMKENENLVWHDNWDPTNVWIESLKEVDGFFTLVGAAQSDGDVTQLAHRLSASMYFDAVQPEGSSKKKVRSGGLTVYSFRITGKVRY